MGDAKQPMGGVSGLLSIGLSSSGFDHRALIIGL